VKCAARQKEAALRRTIRDNGGLNCRPRFAQERGEASAMLIIILIVLLLLIGGGGYYMGRALATTEVAAST
jgi:hypothetical protein